MDGPAEPGFPDGFDDDSGHGLIDADGALTLLNKDPEEFTIFLPTVWRSFDPSQP